MPSFRTRQAYEAIQRRSVQRTDAIDGSFTTGGAPLSAADVGATATITIAAHTRRYPAESGIAPVSLAGGTITGKAFATDYYVYYDDPTFKNPAPTFAATTDPKVAQANYVTGRHSLGKVTTPADGAGSTSGGGAIPPSGGSNGAVIP